MKLASALSVIGTIMGGAVLSMLIARFYPSLDPLNRLYAAVFISSLVTMGLLVYNLTEPSWKRALLRSYSWWPLPLAFMLGGVLCALGAYFIWGVAPIYFKSIQEVPAEEILTHRIIWSFFFMLLLLTVTRHWGYLRQVIKQPKKILILGVTATTIACNWLIYIWAVNNGHMLQASLGYFINPLVNVLFGMLFLQERFRRMQWVAVGLALTGVLIQLWQFGSVPVIGLSLAVTFATYGLLRKKLGVDAQIGMTFETLWLLPVGIIFLLFFADSPTSNMAMNDWHLNALLIAAGVITIVPLLLFTEAANHLRLSTLGFFQYMGPSIMFLLAVFMYGEVITSELLITFGFIWVALILFTLDALYTQQKLRKK